MHGPFYAREIHPRHPCKCIGQVHPKTGYEGPDWK